MHEAEVKFQSEFVGLDRYKQQHKQRMDQFRMFINCYYHSLEGKQAKRYRQNFSEIASPLSQTVWYYYMIRAAGSFNKLMSRIGKSDPWIEEKECEEVKELLREFEETWTFTKNILNISSGLGTKYHYLFHCVEYMVYWRLPIGYISEQSTECFHKTCSAVFRRYNNQRGCLRVKYSMHQLMVITSPSYQGAST